MVYFNCLIISLYDNKTKRIRLKPVDGQDIPILFVRCSRKQRESLPIGSIFTIDVKLVESKNRKPYFLARTPFSLMQLSLF